MVYRCGFSKRLGPVALMDTEEVFISRNRTRTVVNIGTELATIAMAEIKEVSSTHRSLYMSDVGSLVRDSAHSKGSGPGCSCPS